MNSSAPSASWAAGRASAPAWYCLRTRPKRESVAAFRLQDRTGLEVFAPRLSLVRKGRRTTPSTEPLFPGYIFAHFDLTADARFVGSSPDVLGLVRFGDYAPPVEPQVIAFLKEQTATTHTVEPVLALGEWVEVLTGAFMGQTGRIVGFSEGRERACLLLALLGSEVKVHLPLQSLRLPSGTHAFPSPLLASSA